MSAPTWPTNQEKCLESIRNAWSGIAFGKIYFHSLFFSNMTGMLHVCAQVTLEDTIISISTLCYNFGRQHMLRRNLAEGLRKHLPDSAAIQDGA